MELAPLEAACTCDAVESETAASDVGNGVITPAGEPEDGEVLDVELAEEDGGAPRVAPDGYHWRLPKATGNATRSSAAGTWLVVKASGPELPG